MWMDKSRACRRPDFLYQCRVPQLPGSNEMSRFDFCPSDTCPPISSQTAQGVNKPKDSISVFTRRRERGDQLEKNYCQLLPRRMGSYCIPISPLFSNRNCFQKRWECLKCLLTVQSSCPPDVGFNGLAVHGMGNRMLQFLKISTHTTNMTLAGPEARRESDLVKKQAQLAKPMRFDPVAQDLPLSSKSYYLWHHFLQRREKRH